MTDMPRDPSPRFTQRVADPKVAHDIRVVSGLIEIYCKGTHQDRSRSPLDSAASQLGVYGSHPPKMCEECADHARYAETRRAYCPQDPKPFCAHCETHCYKPDEAEWERRVMRYAGPRSLFSRYASDAIKHMRDSRRWRKTHGKM